MSSEKGVEKYRSRAANYASKGEKSSRQVREKLEAWSEGALSREEIEAIVEELQHHRIVDDARYAAAYVSDKVKFGRRGPLLLRHELRSKGISEGIIEERLSAINEEEWLQTLTDFLQEKLKTYDISDPYALRAKLFRAGAAKGFSSEMISKALRRMNFGTDDFED